MQACELAISMAADPLLGEIQDVGRRANRPARGRLHGTSLTWSEECRGADGLGQEVLALIAEGLTNRKIRKRCSSASTARVHVSHILPAQGCRSG